MKIVALLVLFAFVQVEGNPSIREAIGLLRQAVRAQNKILFAGNEEECNCKMDKTMRLFLSEKCSKKCEDEEKEEMMEEEEDDTCICVDGEERFFLADECKKKCDEEAAKEEKEDSERKFMSKRVVVLGQKYKRNEDGTTLVQPAAAPANNDPEQQNRQFPRCWQWCEYCDRFWCWLDCC